jgi:4-amino-4-deoxy-L-arabinose transferase-like glycosyltransferase
MAVLLLAVTTHVGYFVLDRDHETRDSGVYLLNADSLAAGRGFTRAGVVETRRTPGYPLVLMPLRAAGLGLRSIALVQHLASAALAAGFVLVVRRMTGDLLTSVATGTIMAVDLPSIHHANKILTETTFTVVLLIVFVLAWRIAEHAGRPLLQGAIAGLLLGAAALIRPVAVAFFVPVALYLVWTRRDVAARLVALFVACALLLPSLWTLRNDRKTGVAILSSVVADDLLFYKCAGILAVDEPGKFQENFVREQAVLRKAADVCLRHEFRLNDVSKLTDAQRDVCERRMAREIVTEHPLAYAKVAGRGVAVNLLAGGREAVREIAPLSPFVERALLVYTSICVIIASIGVVVLFRTRRNLAVLVVITIGYFIVAGAGPESYSRYRVPVVPMYSLAIAAGLTALRGIHL